MSRGYWSLTRIGVMSVRLFKVLYCVCICNLCHFCRDMSIKVAPAGLAVLVSPAPTAVVNCCEGALASLAIMHL